MPESRLFAVIVSLVFASGASAAPGAERGLRFNSARVLDLANRSLQIEGGKPLAVSELSDDEAQRIFAAPAIGEDPLPLAFSDEVFGCKKASRKCSRVNERTLLARDASVAKRDDEHLTITPANGNAVTFVDWTEPTTKTADGDGETHWYLGRMAGSGYARVEVEFGHDAPGNFLINLQSGKTSFVHNAADVAAPSPDGKYLVTFNTLNAPLSIRLATLDADGPRLTLQCQAPEEAQRLTPVFKGWHDPLSFGLVIEIGEQSKSMPRLALSVSGNGGIWRLEASDLARLANTGFHCSAN